ncbi:MAG: DUF1080 domain-containing protein [Candidatus Hydrogenedentota bacterium]
MKKFIGFALIATVAFGMAAQAAPPEGEGWRSLFNGTTLEGWENRSGHEELWQVKDGVIDCNPRIDLPGDKTLWSKESFGDFQLYLEWRIKGTKGEYPMPIVLPDGSHKLDKNGKPIITMMPNADSGIYLRGSSKSQVNIWCWPVGSGEVYGYRMDKNMPPEVRAGVTPKMKADKPIGEWNTFIITMKGDRMTVELNGKKVIENARMPGVPEEGQLALQHHGGYHKGDDKWSPASSLVQFRNIYIKELEEK